MKTSLTLATSVAFGVLMSASALGQSNNAHIVQDGTSNSASISQGGSSNRAGYLNYKTYGSDPILQDGNNNLLTINQAGSNNEAGVSTVGSDYSGSGIDQLGNRNSLNIQQLTNGSKVHQVQQTASDAATSATNVLTITQKSHSTTANISNRVNSVVQEHIGGAGQNSVEITQETNGVVNGQIIGNGTQTSNSTALGVVQRGSGNQLVASQKSNGGPNRIVYMLQNGNSNGITATQTGKSNLIGYVDDSVFTPTSGIQQIGNSNTATVSQIGDTNRVISVYQNGNSNSATLLFTGNGNGSTDFGTGFNDLGLTQGTVTQGDALVAGHNNALFYNVTGNSNLFAFSQLGSGNQIGGGVSGDSNQAAVLQTGDTNNSTFTQYGGFNSISISQ